MASTPTDKLPDLNSAQSDRTAIRQSFRVPVELQDDIVVVLDNGIYPVVDIGPEGVNISNKNLVQFKPGQRFKNCELIIAGRRIKGLTAKIVHCSEDSAKNKNNGIQWIDLTDDAQDQIVAVVSSIKQKLREAAKKK